MPLAVAAAAVALIAAGPPTSNQTVLTARQSQRLVDYSTAIGTCLRRSGLPVGRPHATRTQITLTVSGSHSQRAVVQAGLRCGSRIGDPPLDSSMQGFPDRIVLYVPKQCLLDAKIARES